MHLMIHSSVTLEWNKIPHEHMTNQQDNKKKPHLQYLKQCHNEESAKNERKWCSILIEIQIGFLGVPGREASILWESPGLVTAFDSKTKDFCRCRIEWHVSATSSRARTVRVCFLGLFFVNNYYWFIYLFLFFLFFNPFVNVGLTKIF